MVKYDTNEAYIKRIKKKVANWEIKHFIVLGNHWNEQVPEFSDKHVTSIWLPFGSVNFAERKENSPLDLLHTPGQVTNQQRNETAMYAQHNCGLGGPGARTSKSEAGSFREDFWDKLNQRISDWNSGHPNDILPLGVAVEIEAIFKIK